MNSDTKYEDNQEEVDDNSETPEWLRRLVNLARPAGIIVQWAGDEAPKSSVLCNGAELNRDAYQNLFNAIGTKFGAGDGVTTFNVPDLPAASGISYIIYTGYVER